MASRGALALRGDPAWDRHALRESSMPFLSPKLPPYDAATWAALPFPERAQQACRSWATDGYGTPVAIFGVYLLKMALYAWIWTLACAQSPALGGLATIDAWWSHPLALQKAVLWSGLFEVLGLGCGSGPLTGRYVPPLGGPLYWLRRGTVRLPPFPAIPGTRGVRRGGVDVGLYAALIGTAGWALFTPAPSTAQIASVVGCVVLMGLRDKTIFLAFRSEHYLVLLAALCLASGDAAWLAAARIVWLALWFFAGLSKVNHHFAPVVGVMTSNSPVMRSVAMRKRLYRAFPDDLRPSAFATWLGHLGTALEFSVPLVLVWATPGPSLVVGIGLMCLLHLHITTSVPMGVPLEWNVMMVYGGWVLFWAHPEVGVLNVDPLVGGGIVVTSVLVPILGNLFPAAISFLPSMRYYAGNWAMSVWLFKGEAWRRLWEQMRIPAPWVIDQLGLLYDRATSEALVSKVFAFRLMHLHGRALGALVPQAIDGELADYTWVDGEILAGLVLGWNFGDGHLHGPQLLAAVQAACGFEPGILRCVFVESQPMFGAGHAWAIHDAHAGEIAAGEVSVAALRARQPWDWGPIDG